MSAYIIFILLTIISTIIGLWKIFEKTGESGWKAIIPGYNFYIWLKIIKKPMWWFVFLIIPFIDVFVVLLMVVELAKCFKKYGLGAQALSAVFPFIYLPYLGFSSKETYLNPDKSISSKGMG
jgi:signal peptidase I